MLPVGGKAARRPLPKSYRLVRPKTAFHGHVQPEFIREGFIVSSSCELMSTDGQYRAKPKRGSKRSLEGRKTPTSSHFHVISLLFPFTTRPPSYNNTHGIQVNPLQSWLH